MDKGISTSIIIPVLNAGNRIEKQIQSILNQTIVPDEIIILDSESTDDTVEKCKKYKKIKVYSIKRAEFDHGGTRDFGVKKSNGDIVFFLTDDAVIMDDFYIENALKYFEDDKVALVTGRQIARPEAKPIESLTRQFNYPDKLMIRSKEDIARIGIKAFFASDVCSAYRKSAYCKVGGFESPIIISEDMLISARFLLGDFKIVYAPDVRVVHSHSYTCKQQFSRNFDIGVFLAQYDEIFGTVKVQSEGIKMVKWVIMQLMKEHRYLTIIHYIVESASKLMGNKIGKNYKKISYRMIMKCTLNKNYWKKGVN